jgi:UDP-glucose 4-epimerase
MILVTGGAGYIGSVTTELLLNRGEEVVVLDNLFVVIALHNLEGIFYEGDIGDQQLLQRITSEHDIEACIHFAALAYVGELSASLHFTLRTMWNAA